ncbi:hypothetical protein BH10PSE14_BH10PSE14_06700 [soil metagenome]
MFATIDDLILARAADMVEHNGGAIGPAFIMGAASQLQAEIISARDRLLSAPAGAAHVGAIDAADATDEAPEAVAEAAPAEVAAANEGTEASAPAPASKRAAPGKKSS